MTRTGVGTPPDVGVGTQLPTVTVRAGLGDRVGVWAVMLAIVTPLVIAFAVLLPQWVGMMQRGAPRDILFAVAVPALGAILAGVFVGFGRFAGRAAKPSVFDGGGFEIMGTRRPWNAVEALYSNPDLKYMVLVLRERWDAGGETGFPIRKRAIEPSPGALVDLALARDAPVVETRTFTHDELWRERTRRHPPQEFDPDLYRY